MRCRIAVDDDGFGSSDAGTSVERLQCRNSGRIEKRSGRDTALGT